jgi:O-succinylbenzoate synthase
VRIDQVEIFHVRIPLRSGFETSYQHNLNIEKLVLAFNTPDSRVYSECTCKDLPTSTTETVGTVRAALEEFLLPAVMHQQIEGPDACWDIMNSFKGHNMAKACIDNAVWAHAALEAGKPLAELLGGSQQSIPVGVGLGIQSSAEHAIGLIDLCLLAGMQRFKLKIKPGADIEIVRALREHFPDLDLMVDANTAYSWPEDRDRLVELDQFGLLMIEQPLTYRDLHYHAELQAQLSTPICLDESIVSPYHARLAAELGSCRVINVKQGRCGGLTPSREIHQIARDAGIGCWAGNMIETGLGQIYSRHLASLEGFDHASELLPPTYYAEADIIDPPLVLNEDGTVDVPSGPGIGVQIDEENLRRYTVAHYVVS